MGVRGVSGGTRGYSRIVKVMIDGQPVSFRPSGENFLGLELVPLGVIDHIEVIRGPASVLYGANAFLGVSCKVRIDPGRLEQVLMNLCVNARDAMPGGGKNISLQDQKATGPPDLLASEPSIVPLSCLQRLHLFVPRSVCE